MTTYAETVERAADRIERDGFHKGGYYKGWSPDSSEGMSEVRSKIREQNPPCCTLGAIWAEAPVEYQATDVANAVSRQLGLDSYGIPDWNDKPSQRKSRVVAALRRAAQKMNEETK